MADQPVRKFFQDPESIPATAVGYDHPRGMTAASEVLNLRKSGAATRERRVMEWQKAAWGYYDQVGELKFAFNLISQVVSRVMLYVAVVEDSKDVPIDTKDFLEEMPEGHAPGETKKAADIADEGLRLLTGRLRQSELLRLMALNLSIPGECYLLFDKHRDRWVIASIDEFIPGDPPRIQSARSGLGTGGRTLDRNAYVARIWRSHPRWSDEADSSMLGVLDQVEKVVLFDQVMRSIARSRMGAGIIWMANGTAAADGRPIDEAIGEQATTPVEDEASKATVTPLVISGPPDAKEPKRLDLSRPLDEELIQAADNALDRTLAGLDIPKDVVSGLADVRYANAVVIDDSLYKAHIEPLVLLICDALTSAYLHPFLKRKGVDQKLIQRLVVWYNPSQIVTRPDRSQAANEGYDRYLLSGEAWRRSRGFSDLDAPDEKEILKRLGLEKATLPPEMAGPIIEALAPDFFRKLRQSNAGEGGGGGLPSEVTELLNPGGGNGAAPEESQGQTDASSGGPVNPNGSLPPRPGSE